MFGSQICLWVAHLLTTNEVDLETSSGSQSSEALMSHKRGQFLSSTDASGNCNHLELLGSFCMRRLEDLLGSLSTLTFLPAPLQKSYFKTRSQSLINP